MMHTTPKIYEDIISTIGVGDNIRPPPTAEKKEKMRRSLFRIEL